MKLLFDVGGTNIRIGISNDGNKLDAHEIFKTPESFEECLDLMTQKAIQISNGEKPEIVIIGIAGVISSDKSQLNASNNLPDWVNRQLKQILEDRFKSNVYIENDAVLAGLGEAGYGAGKEYKIVGFLTFSTGIGGVKIVNGRVDENKYGFEPGGMIINADSNLTLAELASGKAITKKYNQSPDKISDRSIWTDIASHMAIGINNAVVLWSPEVMVIGGGLTKSVNLEEVKEFTKKAMRAFTEVPEIKIAELGDFVGLYGALQYSKQV